MFRASLSIAWCTAACIAGASCARAANPPAAATGAVASAPAATAAASQPGILKGKIASFNYGGRGELQGFMLATGDKAVQINVSHEIEDALKALHAGDAIEVTPRDANAGPDGPGGPDMGGFLGLGGFGGPPGRGGPADAHGPAAGADHEVFDAASITDAQGHTYSHGGPGEHAQHSQVKVESTLKAFNYDHNGLADGLQLANGDLVHLGDSAASMKLTANQAITVEGEAETMSGGGRLIRPTTLNGQTINVGPAGPGGPDGPGGRGGPGVGGPGGPGGGVGGGGFAGNGAGGNFGGAGGAQPATTSHAASLP